MKVDKNRVKEISPMIDNEKEKDRIIRRRNRRIYFVKSLAYYINPLTYVIFSFLYFFFYYTFY